MGYAALQIRSSCSSIRQISGRMAAGSPIFPSESTVACSAFLSIAFQIFQKRVQGIKTANFTQSMRGGRLDAPLGIDQRSCQGLAQASLEPICPSATAALCRTV